jgi:hypothetical protein
MKNHTPCARKEDLIIANFQFEGSSDVHLYIDFSFV